MQAFDRYLPIAYFALAAIVIAFLLPTALRPPDNRPPSSAAFSPEQSEDSEVIVSELNRGRSGVASGLLQPQQDGVPQVVAGAPPRACPAGVGLPPRQAESIYAPPCAAAFQGDNGGATWKGVTQTEVRIAVQGLLFTGTSRDGYVGDTPQEGENDVDRTLRVLQQYFNNTFQLWGRKLRIYRATPSGQSDVSQRAAAQKADDEYKVFGAGLSTASGCDEYARRKLVASCGIFDHAFYANRSPYTFGWYMEGSQLMRFASEYICKKLAGKPAAFAGDPVLQSTPRRFGLVYYDGPNNATDGFSAFFGPLARELETLLREQCDVQLESIAFNNNSTGETQSAFAAALARFRAAGVTTVIPFMDWVAALQLTNAAQSNGYVPEWFVVGTGALDRNQLGQLQNQAQWAHAFGITSLEMERHFSVTDCYRAYKSVDPDNTPQFAICNYAYQPLYMLVAGMQQAGPRLTPQSFQAGLQRLGYRFHTRPVWAIGGGFSPSDFTYTDNVAEIWYDPAAPDPTGNAASGAGAYRYTAGGKRYRLGEIPREDPALFREGATTTPDSDAG